MPVSGLDVSEGMVHIPFLDYAPCSLIVRCVCLSTVRRLVRCLVRCAVPGFRPFNFVRRSRFQNRSFSCVSDTVFEVPVESHKAMDGVAIAMHVVDGTPRILGPTETCMIGCSAIQIR